MTKWQHTPKSVFRYIPILKQICDGAQTASFDPMFLGLSVETCTARLRDAANSLISGQTTHPSIDATKLASVWKSYKVINDGKLVHVVPRAEKKEEQSFIAVPLGEQIDVLAVVEAKDTDIVLAFALLLSRRFITGKVRILGQVKVDLSKFDVELVEELTGSIMI